MLIVVKMIMMVMTWSKKKRYKKTQSVVCFEKSNQRPVFNDSEFNFEQK